MEPWLWWMLGGLVVMIVADIIIAGSGSTNILTLGMWLGSAYMVYKAWEISPWKETFPTISLISMFAVYGVVGFGSAVIFNKYS